MVVTDWMMPGITGIELCRSIRDSSVGTKGNWFYIIILTGKLDVSAVVDALDEGADDYVRKPFDPRELGARIRAGIRVIESESRLRLATERLVELAKTDSLTRLFNRLRGNEVLENELSRAGRRSQSLLVALVDLDHFKQVNDVYGHNAGDRVLKIVSARMLHQRRKYDAVIRWGGEEFLVILPHASREDAPGIGERLCRTFSREPVALDSGEVLEITASFGLAYTICEPDLGPAELIERADRALYRAKEAGRDRYVVFEAIEE